MTDRTPQSPREEVGMDLVPLYEDLRHEALAQSSAESRPGSGRGLALFLRAGMAAWMQACRGIAFTQEPKVARATGSNLSISPDLRSELASLLAAMALNCGKELNHP